MQDVYRVGCQGQMFYRVLRHRLTHLSEVHDSSHPVGWLIRGGSGDLINDLEGASITRCLARVGDCFRMHVLMQEHQRKGVRRIISWFCSIVEMNVGYESVLLWSSGLTMKRKALRRSS